MQRNSIILTALNKSRWLKHYVMSFSYKEQRKKALNNYRKKISEIENMEPDEIDFEYITIKTAYEHKKSVLTIFIISIALSVLLNVWNYFFIFIEKTLQYAALFKGSEIEIATVSFAIGAIIAVCITFLLVFILVIYMKEMYRIQKELMMIETVKNKQSKEQKYTR